MMKKNLFLVALVSTIIQMNAQTTVFGENFNAASGIALPTGWTSQDLNGSTDKWESNQMSWFGTVPGFSGKVCVAGGLLNPNMILSSPAIALPAGSPNTLTYQIGTLTMGFLPFDNHYALYILPSTATFTGSETPVLEETTSAGNTAFAKTIDLSGYGGQNIRLYYRLFNSPEKGFLAVDNIKITQSTLGTSEVSNNAQVGIYPNPSTDYINIKSESKINNVEIFDMIGRKMTTILNDNKIDVRNLQSGNYILKIETKEGVSTEKFIKK